MNLQEHVNEKAAEAAQEQKVEQLKLEVMRYLERLRLDSPVGHGEVVETHTLMDAIVLIFEGGQYYATALIPGYNDYPEIIGGAALSPYEAEKCGLLQGVAVWEEFKLRRDALLKRRDAASAAMEARRLVSTYGKDFIKKAIGD